LPRAGEYAGKLDALKLFSKLPRFFLAARRQRKIRPTRVLTGKRPLSLAVANQVNSRQSNFTVRHAGSWIGKDRIRWRRLSASPPQ